MTMGPDPRMRIFWMSDRFGMRVSRSPVDPGQKKGEPLAPPEVTGAGERSGSFPRLLLPLRCRPGAALASRGRSASLSGAGFGLRPRRTLLRGVVRVGGGGRSGGTLGLGSPLFPSALSLPIALGEGGLRSEQLQD